MNMFFLMINYNTGFLVLFLFIVLLWGIHRYIQWTRSHNAEVLREAEEQERISKGEMKSLCIEKVIPLPKDLPNRMTLHFPTGFKVEDPGKLRKRLTADLESMVHEVRVHQYWMSLEKNSNESWSEVLAKTKNVLEEVLQKPVIFTEKDNRKVALK